MRTNRRHGWAALCLALGVSAHAQILIGQTAGLTGSVGDSVNEAVAGSKLVIDAVNAQGGVHGELIEIKRLDDAFDPKRAADNARTLIEDDKVLALFMTRGTPHSLGIIPLLDKHGVPLIGPSTGAMALHKPVQRNVFNVRATYQREAEKAVHHLSTVGMTRIAVVHVTDSFGADALEGAQKGLAAVKLEPVAMVAADRAKPDYASIIPQLVQSQAQAVIWIGSGTAVIDGVKALRKAGSAAQVVTLSNNASSGFIKALGDASGGVIVTQVFPNERSMATPMVKEAMALAKGKPLSPITLEGFASAKVLVEALRRAGPKPTRARIHAALESLRDYDLGGLEVSYSPQDHSGIDYADLSIISEGRFKR